MKQKMIGIDMESSKYRRNPRMKGYMLCKRAADGSIQCLADESIMTVTWSSTIGILWFEHKSPTMYQKNKDGRLLKALESGEEAFVVRVNSKDCPVEVDFINEAPRARKGNVYFKQK